MRTSISPSSLPSDAQLAAATWCGHLIPQGSVYAFLADHRHELFPAELFADRPPPDLEALLVAREPLLVAVHPTHPLAGHDQVQLRALREEPMVTLTRASKLRSTLETACRAAGFAPRIVAETSDLGVMVQLAAEQLGVAVLPASGLAGTTELVQLRLTRPELDRRLLLVWQPAASPPAARAFLTLAHQHLTPSPGST